jgi:hypothetical protein
MKGTGRLIRMEIGLKFTDRQRLCEVEALEVVSTVGNQRVDLGGVLHAFGNDAQLERL